MKYGKLFLVPTSIAEHGTLPPSSFKYLEKAVSCEDIICVEDIKPGRRRWIKWGLPKEAVETFTLFNEHTSRELVSKLTAKIKSGKNVFLLSDGGTPAFCDPGQNLVNTCHQKNIDVLTLETDNSVISSLALSGFSHQQFYFAGFPPKKTEERISFYESLLAHKTTLVFMDTPYRLTRVLEELTKYLNHKAQVSISIDLCRETQQTLRGQASQLLKNLKGQKREFVVVIDNH